MWSIETWNEIQLFLPDSGCGDRVVITTRLSDMAALLSSFPFEMKFLDEEKSWRLFCAKAFGEEECPPELEEIGRDIVRKCKGLAPSIVVMGGHLRKSSRMKLYWESIGNDINSVLDSGEDQCSSILSLSYNHLPAHLKPCFLYTAVFEEDREIRCSYLINLWVAEGFLTANEEKSKEQIAEEYLKDLVDRNLILVHKWDHNRKFYLCKIHYLLRELSIRVARKENFFRVLHRKIEPEFHVWPPLRRPRVSSIKFEGCEVSSKFGSVKAVIDKVVVVLGVLLESDFQHVNLRYLDCYFIRPENASRGNLLRHRNASHSNFRPTLYLPPSISLIWNLQTIKISGAYDKIVAPEIWKMPQLRHVEVERLCLPNPPHINEPILQNLLTLEAVQNFILSEDVCNRIPNIKQLDLRYNFHGEHLDSRYDFHWKSDEATIYYYPQNLGCFHKLESLSCSLSGKPNWNHFARDLTFPSLLQELCLYHFPFQWDDLTMISSLPHLVELRLFRSVHGSEWHPIDMGFPCLRHLGICGCESLVSWNAESSHFPVLEHVYLGGACKLDEIPSGIGDIPTLQRITLHDCSDSAAISAARILVEQQELGNDGLHVEVRLWKKEKLASFSEMLREEGLTSNNLYLKHHIISSSLMAFNLFL